jgi:2-polyprenyl-3-methyl-5-hydroxy-6-metoxy-1,4-benzoquinol methylase
MDAEPAADLRRLTDEARQIWDQKATWWDSHFGEDANLFVRPTVERLLDLQPGQRVLDIACGNGAFSRRMAQLGARVVACDFSETFLRLARARTAADLAGLIEYRLVDATDEAQVLALGPEPFDAAVCTMGLMDMATIEPLMGALSRLLKPAGRFVFAVTHPCFNTGGVTRVIEEEDRAGQLVTTRSVQVSRYLTPRIGQGVGVIGEPLAHTYFDRPLNVLFAPCFQAGFVLDSFEELAANPPREPAQHRPGSWSHFQEIPLFLVVRLRRWPATP